jgi:DNA-binding NarL/FixJ family response regulator
MVSQQTSMRPSRILIVDDHPMVRKALSLRIAQNSKLMVCAAVGTVAHALEAIELHRPDLAVLDLQLPDGSGLDLIKVLREDHPKTLILVFSMQPKDIFLPLTRKAGAHAFVTKSDAPSRVIEAIDQVLGRNADTLVNRVRALPTKKRRASES